jgi:hypothetical protein
MREFQIDEEKEMRGMKEDEGPGCNMIPLATLLDDVRL